MICDGAGFNAFRAANYFINGGDGQQLYEQFPVHVGCTTGMLDYIDGNGNILVAGNETPPGAVGVREQPYHSTDIWRDPCACLGGDDYTAFTDSAAAATALYTGMKTTRGRIGVGWDGIEPRTSIAQLAQQAGKRVGVVTSVQASHATPAAFAAKRPNRDEYSAIFRDMLHRAHLDVIMGAGHPWFNDAGCVNRDLVGEFEPVGFNFVGGEDAWRELTDGLTDTFLAQSKTDFEWLARGEIRSGRAGRRVVGIPQVHATLQCRRPLVGDQPPDPLNAHVPSLSTMVRGALEALSSDDHGLLLLVEGGAVDWANHDNHLIRMIEELNEFNAAVEEVDRWIKQESSWDETLLIVTSDHECGMLWGPQTYVDRDGDGRFNPQYDTFLKWDAVENRGKGKLPGVSYGSGGHTSMLAPVWAAGIGCERIRDAVRGVDRTAARVWDFSGGYIDNTDIFHVMRQAIGEESTGNWLRMPSVPELLAS